MVIILTLYLILLLLLLLTCDNELSSTYYIPVKTTCSLYFIAMGFHYFLKCQSLSYATRIIIALAFCALGDVLMALYNQRLKKRTILFGMVAFILGHIGFIAAMHVVEPHFSLQQIIIPAIAVIAFLVLYKLCHIHMGRLKYAALIYTIVVSSMMGKAISIFYSLGSSASLITVGGVLFFLSDFLIIFLYFFHFKSLWRKRIIHYLNLVTYYMAIYAFCISLEYVL